MLEDYALEEVCRKGFLKTGIKEMAKGTTSASMLSMGQPVVEFSSSQYDSELRTCVYIIRGCKVHEQQLAKSQPSRA